MYRRLCCARERAKYLYYTLSTTPTHTTNIELTFMIVFLFGVDPHYIILCQINPGIYYKNAYLSVPKPGLVDTYKTIHSPHDMSSSQVQ